MATDWIEYLEQTLPQSLGFGKLIEYGEPFWHSTDNDAELEGDEIITLVGQTIKVARMYEMAAGQVKFRSLTYSLFIRAEDNMILCCAFRNPLEIEEREIWPALSQAIQLMAVSTT